MKHMRVSIYGMLPYGTALGYDDYCSYWNEKIMKNCSKVDEALTQVQTNILAPKFGHYAKKCNLCSVVV